MVMEPSTLAQLFHSILTRTGRCMDDSGSAVRVGRGCRCPESAKKLYALSGLSQLHFQSRFFMGRPCGMGGGGVEFDAPSPMHLTVEWCL